MTTRLLLAIAIGSLALFPTLSPAQDSTAGRIAGRWVLETESIYPLNEPLLTEGLTKEEKESMAPLLRKTFANMKMVVELTRDGHATASSSAISGNQVTITEGKGIWTLKDDQLTIVTVSEDGSETKTIKGTFDGTNIYLLLNLGKDQLKVKLVRD